MIDENSPKFLKGKIDKQAQRISELINRPYKNTTEFKRILKANIEDAMQITDKTVKDFVAKEIRQEWAKGEYQASKEIPKESRKPIPPKIAKEKVSKLINNTYVEISSKSRLAYKQTWDSINKILKKTTAATPMTKVRDLVKERLTAKNITTVHYKGRKAVPLSVYSEMIARTSRTETFNTASIEYAKRNTDLVYIPSIFPTCEICIMYQDRVYSISGNSDKYPALYETAFGNGYETIHPNCRHRAVPYMEELQNVDELERNRKQSNRPFADTRTIKNKREYQEWQEKNRKAHERAMAKVEKPIEAEQ